MIFENTQEPIIDEETFQTAQKLRKTGRRPTSLGEANPLTGLLYCADCGARLYNERGDNGKGHFRDSIPVGRAKSAQPYDGLQFHQ